MRMKYESPSDVILGIKSGQTKIGKIWNMVGMYPLMLGDALASVITWDAAYNKARESGLIEMDARLEADSAVRNTQSDSMALFRVLGYDFLICQLSHHS